MKRGQGPWLDEVDSALAALKADGELQRIWQQWMPSLAYPF